MLSDIATLRTLPPRELRAGLAEVIKYGLIRDVAFLEWIEEALDELLACDGCSARACDPALLRDQGADRCRR